MEARQVCAGWALKMLQPLYKTLFAWSLPTFTTEDILREELRLIVNHIGIPLKVTRTDILESEGLEQLVHLHSLLLYLWLEPLHASAVLQSLTREAHRAGGILRTDHDA